MTDRLDLPALEGALQVRWSFVVLLCLPHAPRVFPWLVFTCCLVVAVTAHAQDFGATARVDRQRVTATHAADPSASGTTLVVADRVMVPVSLADVVREAPGARVQSTGGLGAFSTVSLRGGDGEEVTVMIDEIPLTTADGGAFDLGLFSPELFESVNVFRGGSPVWLGSGAIGGVLQLMPRRETGRSTDAAAGAGSFGLWRVQGGASTDGPSDLRFNARLVLRAARNDYPYDDDRGTAFDASDDRELRRKNAQIDDASAFLDVSRTLGRGTLHLITLAHARTGGFPGPASQPTPNIHRQSARALTGMSYTLGSSGKRRKLQLVGATSYNLDRYSDYYGELGTSQRWETDDQAYRTFVRAAGTVRFVRWLEATLVGSYALDRYAWQNTLAYPRPAPSTRHTGAAALEFLVRERLGPILFELRPSARLEWSQTTLHADRGLSGEFKANRDVLAPTARLGAAFELLEGVALSGSIATGTRVPTNYELFGDRGLVLPSPGLEPVRSVTYDGGITLRGARAGLEGSMELRGFKQDRRDAIGMFRTAQWQVLHRNVSSVEQYGAELGARGSYGGFTSLYASATFLETETALEKRLPFRARWVASARPEARARIPGKLQSVARVGADLYYRSIVYADQANLAYVPRCFTTGVSTSLSLFRALLEISARVDDVADARCSDLVGYPLPGRTVFVSVRIKESADD